MRRTNIYLADEQTRHLDEIARSAGISRAELVRRMIDRALAGTDDDLSGDLAAIDESFGTISSDDVDVVRGSSDREKHHERVWKIAS